MWSRFLRLNISLAAVFCTRCSGSIVDWTSSRWMCCETEKSLAMSTPITFRERLRVIPGSCAGSGTLLPLRRLSVKITSQDLLQFNRRLFRSAHAWIFVSSAWRQASLLAGITKYVSSANLHSEFPAVAAARSTAVTTYACQRTTLWAINLTILIIQIIFNVLVWQTLQVS